MRLLLLAIVISLFTLLPGCAPSRQTPPPDPAPATDGQTETPAPNPPPTAEDPAKSGSHPTDGDSGQANTYQNEIFQEVRVTKGDAPNTYEVKGKARVFEGVFSYVVEDGHNELAKGSVQTTAGAPEWGEFSFTVTVAKENPNLSLLLILFETSPKDGSRRMELPVPLPE